MRGHIDSPSCSWRAARKQQCRSDQGKKASSPAHCSSTSSSFHTWKKSKNRSRYWRELYDLSCTSQFHGDSCQPLYITAQIKGALGLQHIAFLIWQDVREALCRAQQQYRHHVNDHVHVMRCVLGFGHPVSTLDLVVEAWIHDHPGVWGAACRPKQILISLSKNSSVNYFWTLTDVCRGSPNENISQSRMP